MTYKLTSEGSLVSSRALGRELYAEELGNARLKERKELVLLKGLHVWSTVNKVASDMQCDWRQMSGLWEGKLTLFLFLFIFIYLYIFQTEGFTNLLLKQQISIEAYKQRKITFSSQLSR